MIKTLFLSTVWALPEMCGAKFLTRFRRDVLLDVCGKDCVDVLVAYWKKNETPEESHVYYECTFKNLPQQLTNIINGNVHFISEAYNRRVLDMIKENDYKLLVYDDAAFGKLSGIIKEKYPDIMQIAMYHGVEKQFAQSMYSGSWKNRLRFYQYNAMIRSEYKQAQNVDANIMLNNRDADNFYKYNGVKAKAIMPIGYIDTSNNTDTIAELPDGKTALLFVGSHYLPNVEGAKWFATEVMPRIKDYCHLYVVGFGMEEYAQAPEFTGEAGDSITIVGTVDDLAPWYKAADIVIGPILRGDGMKTKTAEALMYGKHFIGTTESLIGYDMIDNCECNTPDEYVSKIDEFIASPHKKYYEEQRKLYEKYYSYEAATNIIRKLLEEVKSERENNIRNNS